jgi:hypothetical protein
MKRHYWSGIILIVIGLLMLLDEMDIMALEWFDILFCAFVVIGISKFSNGLNRTDRHGILGGTFFTSFGMLMLLISNRVLVTADEFVFAVFFLCLVLANIVYFVLGGYHWFNLAWAVIFSAISGLFMLGYYGDYSYWHLYDIIATYWPVAFILSGLNLLLRGIKKHQALT